MKLVDKIMHQFGLRFWANQVIPVQVFEGCVVQDGEEIAAYTCTSFWESFLL